MCDSAIKKGALVKAWDEGGVGYVVAKYDEYKKGWDHPHIVDYEGGDVFKNAIEIPEELAKQLEELGK